MSINKWKPEARISREIKSCIVMRRFISLSVMFVLLILIHVGCEKEDDNDPINPTNGKTTALFNSDVTYGTMTDQDGNTYKTVVIGTQTWMAENLRTTKYNDGTPVPYVITNEWGEINIGAYCNYGNTNDLDTIATYGCLYNWFALNTGKLAPKGWHVPSDAEWTVLITYLGGESVAWGKLKEASTAHWTSPNSNATNESGFTALPSGLRDYNNDIYSNIGSYGYWWSATEFSSDDAWFQSLTFNLDGGRFNNSKRFGFAIRCVKD